MRDTPPNTKTKSLNTRAILWDSWTFNSWLTRCDMTHKCLNALGFFVPSVIDYASKSRHFEVVNPQHVTAHQHDG